VLFNPLLRVVLFVALAALVGVLAAIALALFAPQLLESVGAMAVAQIVVTVAAYLLLVTLIERRRPPVELAPKRALGLVWGLGGGAVAFGVSYLVIVLLGGLRLEGLAQVNWGHWWLQVLLVGAAAGISEEILFRGILFRVVEEFTGTWIAALVSGVFFGFAHLGNPDANLWGAIAIALEAGVLLAVLYAYTRSLWIVIGFHAAWNVVQGPVLGVIVSGTGSGAPSIFRTSAQGHDLISGGVFGAEASIITVLLLVAATVVIAVALVRRRAVVAPMWVRRARQAQASIGAHSGPVSPSLSSSLGNNGDGLASG
jgi:membrane protease YdiL (CAAX protease family)